MKKIFLLFLLCTAHALAVSQSEIDAWKGRAPSTNQTANPIIKQLATDCGWILRQAAPANFERSLGMLRAKIEAALLAVNESVRTARNTRKRTSASEDATEAKKFIEGKMLPHLEDGESLGRPGARRPR